MTRIDRATPPVSPKVDVDIENETGTDQVTPARPADEGDHDPNRKPDYGQVDPRIQHQYDQGRKGGGPDSTAEEPPVPPEP